MESFICASICVNPPTRGVNIFKQYYTDCEPTTFFDLVFQGCYDDEIAMDLLLQYNGIYPLYSKIDYNGISRDNMIASFTVTRRRDMYKCLDEQRPTIPQHEFQNVYNRCDNDSRNYMFNEFDINTLWKQFVDEMEDPINY